MRSASTGTRALLQLLRKARRGRAGFTLIEALVEQGGLAAVGRSA